MNIALPPLHIRHHGVRSNHPTGCCNFCCHPEFSACVATTLRAAVIFVVTLSSRRQSGRGKGAGTSPNVITFSLSANVTLIRWYGFHTRCVCVAISCCTLVTRQEYADVLAAFRISTPKTPRTTNSTSAHGLADERERKREGEGERRCP